MNKINLTDRLRCFTAVLLDPFQMCFFIELAQQQSRFRPASTYVILYHVFTVTKLVFPPACALKELINE